MTSPPRPRTQTLTRAFAEVVERHADRVALETVDRALSYAELDRRANATARALIDVGVRPGEAVGLHLDRSVELYVVVLAALKAGACVVPVSPSHPEAARRGVIADTGARFLIHENGAAPGQLGDNMHLLELADLAARATNCDDTAVDRCDDPAATAFVMFTSGSTGRPKGVRIAHRGLTRLAEPSVEFEITNEDCFLAQAPFSFAASTIEIWQSLLHGAKLAVLPPPVPTVRELRAALKRHGVTFLSLPGGLFNVLVDEDPATLQKLRVIVLSGDFPSPRHLTRAAAHTEARIYNGYGCTEASSLVLVHRVDQASDAVGDADTVPVGRPMPGMAAEVLDEQLRPCAPHVTGELCLAGDGVALGYINDDAATAARFVTPAGAMPGESTCYRTGDRAHLTPDGDVVLVGRSDDMVKIRGFRVELRAVELALKAHPDIDQAAVIAVGDAVTPKRLAAFHTAGGHATPTTDELVTHLREHLPEHMIPSDFHQLDRLPANINGKTDRAALAQRVATPRHSERVEPGASPLEIAVARIWKTITGAEDYRPADGFVERGGTSLHLVQLASQLETVLGVTLSMEDVLTHDSATALARHVENLRAQERS